MIDSLSSAELLLIGTIIVLTPLIFFIGLVTVGLSIRKRRVERRREDLQQHLSQELFSKLFSDDPNWEKWVKACSAQERRALRRLLPEYLRLIRGAQYDQLCELGVALDMETDAKRKLARRSDRFRALTWLALLGKSVDPARLEKHCTDTPTLRAAAARVLIDSDHPEAALQGTKILLGDGTGPLSAFGLDVLHQLNNGAENPLLSIAADHAQDWDRRVLVQVLTVLRFCHLNASGEQLGWILPLLEHDSIRVRLASVGLLKRHGWRPTLRAQLDIEMLLADSDSRVRIGTFMALASWGDATALRWLLWGQLIAKTQRERLGHSRALAVHPQGKQLPVSPTFEQYDRWVQAELSIRKQRQRHWGVATWT